MGTLSGPGKGGDRAAWLEAQERLETWTEHQPGVWLALAEPSRAARRGVAAAIDQAPTAARDGVRASLASLAEEPAQGTTERLLRRARGADTAAQVRRNPIHRNESFECAQCGRAVPAAPGGGVRNHCPWCLCSVHVDGAVPGDRASTCHGVMHPVEFDTTTELSVHQRCARCGHERRNRLHPEWDVAPDIVDPARLRRDAP